jgi:hypothetical protein
MFREGGKVKLRENVWIIYFREKRSALSVVTPPTLAFVLMKGPLLSKLAVAFTSGPGDPSVPRRKGVWISELWPNVLGHRFLFFSSSSGHQGIEERVYHLRST